MINEWCSLGSLKEILFAQEYKPVNLRNALVLLLNVSLLY